MQNKNIQIPPITQPDDLLNISENYLEYLPTFMFSPEKVDLGRGKWKHVYPKDKNHLRRDFEIVGRHVVYQ